MYVSWSKCLNQLENDVYRPGIVQDAKGRSCLSVGCETNEYEGPIVDLVDQYYRVPQVFSSFTTIHMAIARCHRRRELPQNMFISPYLFWIPSQSFRRCQDKKDLKNITLCKDCRTTILLKSQSQPFYTWSQVCYVCQIWFTIHLSKTAWHAWHHPMMRHSSEILSLCFSHMTFVYLYRCNPSYVIWRVKSLLQFMIKRDNICRRMTLLVSCSTESAMPSKRASRASSRRDLCFRSRLKVLTKLTIFRRREIWSFLAYTSKQSASRLQSQLFSCYSSWKWSWCALERSSFCSYWTSFRLAVLKIQMWNVWHFITKASI